MEDDAAYELHVEVAQAGRAPRGLPAQGERLDQQIVELLAFLLAFLGTLPQGVAAGAQSRVVKRFELVLEGNLNPDYGTTGSITAREPSARLTKIWISPESSSR